MSTQPTNGTTSDALAIRTQKLNLWYGTFQALFDVDFDVKDGLITALIGPSGCGKSTLLRSVNRINERLGYVRTEGVVEVMGHNIYTEGVELAQLRKQVGMVFQRPNPLPISIRDNILFGHRLHIKGSRKQNKAAADEIVEKALQEVLLWDTVKDRLGRKATELSLEEQQKLCIARLLPVKPKVLLMDEPCSALDPKATEAVEELIWQTARRVHHPHRDAQHGPGPPRERRMCLHADGQNGGTYRHRRYVCDTSTPGNRRLHRGPVRLIFASFLCD